MDLLPKRAPISARQFERAVLVSNWLPEGTPGALLVAQLSAFVQCETDIPPWEE